MLSIVKHPDPILRRVALPLTESEIPHLQSLVAEMIETMHANKGVGLAAPQIGRSCRLIIVSHKKGDIPMINPEISHRSLLKEWGEEGCLSIPGVFGEVRRSRRVSVRYTDTAGKVQTLQAAGLLARVIQHEIDHLDGILFIDSARNLSDIVY